MLNVHLDIEARQDTKCWIFDANKPKREEKQEEEE